MSALPPPLAPPRRIGRRQGGSLPWPEAVAITAALLLTAAVAAGWFDPMLPWTV